MIDGGEQIHIGVLHVQGQGTQADLDLTALVAAARVVSRLARHLETALAAVDLTMPQYRVLALLNS